MSENVNAFIDRFSKGDDNKLVWPGEDDAKSLVWAKIFFYFFG